MSKKITLLTGSEKKEKSFKQAIVGYNVEVEIRKLWLPEIQSKDNGEVAAYAAKYGANLLNQPVIKMDSGFFIEVLDGFPGPLVHFVDRQIGANLFFKILKGLDNRQARVENALAYCEPNGEPKIFRSGCTGKIIENISQQGEGSLIDRLFVPEHPNNPEHKAIGEIRRENYQKFLEIWGNAEIQFARWFEG